MVWSLSALPTRVARRLRRQVEYALLGYRGFETVTIGRAHAGGVIDGIEVNNDGTLSVVGWSPDADAYARLMTLSARDTSIAPSHVFRVTRPDLAKLVGDHPTRMGLIVEYVLPADWSGGRAILAADNQVIGEIRLPSFAPPPYNGLYGNPGVLTRDHIYGVGPPVRVVSSEILELCDGLDGPLLDFGCGAGVLVSALRRRGLDARGLEIDTPVMREAAQAEVSPFITYYGGAFPAPFEDAAFETVTCCEVLEHIPDPERAVAELARLSRGKALVTVPDMSGVPRGFHHGVVPWHLMERSHVSFFTQQSLGELLGRHFRPIRFFRIGEVRCERLRFYTSLVALCDQKT